MAGHGELTREEGEGVGKGEEERGRSYGGAMRRGRAVGGGTMGTRPAAPLSSALCT
jgi:hypothetical protein